MFRREGQVAGHHPFGIGIVNNAMTVDGHPKRHVNGIKRPGSVFDR